MKTMVLQIIYMLMNTPNPMLILITIITLMLITSTIMFFMTLNYWMSMLVIITYIGGMMIMFLYIISLTPNLKQKWSNLNKMSTITMIIMCSWTTMQSFMIKSPMKTMTFSYSNNTWNLMMIMITIMIMAQMSSKIMNMPFKTMKSTY